MRYKRILLMLIFTIVFPLIINAANYQAGDVNGDNVINVSDYILIRKHIIGISILTEEKQERADVNNDKTITVADYIEIRKKILSGTQTISNTPTPTPTVNPTPTTNIETSSTESSESQVTGKIHFIHTGPSDAILIESNGKYGLIDSSNPYKDGTSQSGGIPQVESVIHVKNYLDKIGVKKLSFVIGTHAHSDHVGGMRIIAQNYVDSNTTYYYRKYQGTSEDTDASTKSWDNNGYYERAVNEMKKYGAKLKEVSGISPSFKLGDFTIKIMHTGSFNKTRENNNSIVTLVTYKNNKHKTLLTADLEIYDELSVANSVKNVEILKLGHHGNETSTSFKYADVLKPKIAVITHNYVREKIYPVVYHMQKEYKTKFYLTGNEPDAVVINYSDAKLCTTTSKAISNYTITKSSGDWQKVNNKIWVIYKDGKISHDTWYQDPSGNWYYLDQHGLYVTGWNKLNWGGSSNWYYFNSGGSMVSNTCKVIGGKNYCFSPSGVCTTGC